MARKTRQTRITSSEKTARINPSNLQLKRDFLVYMKSLQRSAGTIKGYSSDLDIVMTYILDELDNKAFHKLTKRDLIGFQNWMVDRGMSSARIRRIKAAISSLSAFIEDLLDDEPEYDGYKSIVRKIANPPLTPVREKTVWSDAELESLLDQLTKDGEYAKACYVALGMYSGRRKSELARFKMTDFDAGHVVCNGALYRSDPILTKGNRMLECYTLKSRFDPYLENWKRDRVERGIDSEWLFPKADNPAEHIDVSTLNSWAQTFSRMTGRDWYAHSLRHYFVSALSRAGIPDSVVIDIIGWKSADMRKIYDDNPKDDRLARYFGEVDILGGDAVMLGDMNRRDG